MSDSLTLVSAGANGKGNAPSYAASISADGTKVAFTSEASNLATGDTDGNYDVFVKDLATGAVTLVSTGANGKGDGGSVSPSISADGTKVAFISGASNLTPGGNRTSNVFVKDLTTGAVTLVSTGANGAANDYSETPSISADGTKVAFASDATNLVASDTNSTLDIFVKDLTTGAVTLVSTGANGQANSSSATLSISANGTKVAFASGASNLAAGDTNRSYDVFVKDLTTGAVTLISTGANGQGNGVSYSPSISADGTKVAFYSLASNLAAGDADSYGDVFVKDLTTGAVTLVSTGANGKGNGASYSPSISADGTKIAFYSLASNLAAGDTDDTADVFVKDLATGAVTLVSTGANGKGSGASGSASISADGTKVAFASNASNLAAGDTDNTPDVFVRDLSIALPPANRAPTAPASNQVTTPEDTASAAVAIGAADADGDTLSYALKPTATPQKGSVTFGTGAQAGTFTYTPAANANGADGFTVVVSDGKGGSVEQAVSVAVTAVNDAPVVSAPVVLPPGTEDVAVQITPAQLLAGASDVEGAALSVADLAITRGGGTLTANATGWSYTPAADYSGAVGFAYKVSDGALTVAQTAALTLAPADDAPVVTGPVSGTATEDGPAVSLDALANASDTDGATLSVVGVPSGLPAGVSYDAASRRFTLDPSHVAYQGLAAGRSTVVTVGYGVSDGSATTAASVSWTVTGTNDAPVLTGPKAVLAAGTEDTAYTVKAADLLAGYTDVDGDALSVSGLTATNGTVAAGGDGTFTVTPGTNANGPVTLTYGVSDGKGGSVAATQSYTLAPVNDAPVGVADTWATVVDEDTTATIAPAVLLANDTDPDAGDTKTLVSVQPTSAKGATVGFDAASGRITFIADAVAYDTLGAGNTTTDSFTYTLRDGAGVTSTAAVTVTVRGAADGPTLSGGNGADNLTGTVKNERIEGGNGNDALRGAAGSDRLYGGAGDDALSGDAGDDQLWGERGNDRLNGGRNNDVLTGGPGNDLFEFGPLGGDDRITDFTFGEDSIRLTGGVAFDRAETGQFYGGASSARDTKLFFKDATGTAQGTVIVENVTGVNWAGLIGLA